MTVRSAFEEIVWQDFTTCGELAKECFDADRVTTDKMTSAEALEVNVRLNSALAELYRIHILFLQARLRCQRSKLEELPSKQREAIS